MKKITKKIWTVTALLAICFTMFSFSSRWGGEGFEIYLNNKLVLQQFGDQMNAVKTLKLDPGSYNYQLSVKYFHCGKVGKNRDITIRDGQNKILKEWHFTDDASANACMNCPVKEIFAVKKGNGNTTLSLYYSSSELPKGRLIASIVIATENKSGSVSR
jgi:hypothetical protein